MSTNILTIAGSDSCGGAGIQGDLKSISATGAYGLSVITALTSQNTMGVDAIYPVAISFLKQQMQAIAKDIQIDAVKIGMLGTSEVIAAVAEFVDGLQCPIVVDPVMVAKSGDRLLQADAVILINGNVASSTRFSATKFKAVVIPLSTWVFVNDLTYGFDKISIVSVPPAKSLYVPNSLL